MLKKLRLKFVCFTMALVTVMLCVIFGLVLRFTAQSLAQQSIRAMEAVAADPMQSFRPGETSDRIHLPCFVIHLLPRGQVRVSGSEIFDLDDPEWLRELLEEVQDRDESIGLLEDYNLRYYNATEGLNVIVVFADISSEQATMRGLWKTSGIIGGIAFLIFLGLSLLLARWAVKPVEKAWIQQRQFVADASHELKTPLTIITTNAELLSDPLCPQPQVRSENILSTARQMRGLVEGLLELARADNGTLQTNFTRLSLSELISDSVLPFEALYFEAGLKLEWRIDPDIAVQGSETHLRQLPEILLDNALKYTRSGGRVFLGLQRQGNQCLLTVSNEGDPISREDLKNIFKRFYRADSARQRDGSYGLGLSIAENIAKIHNGRIWATSEGGRNTFFVQLPAAK